MEVYVPTSTDLTTSPVDSSLSVHEMYSEIVISKKKTKYTTTGSAARAIPIRTWRNIKFHNAFDITFILPTLLECLLLFTITVLIIQQPAEN